MVIGKNLVTQGLSQYNNSWIWGSCRTNCGYQFTMILQTVLNFWTLPSCFYTLLSSNEIFSCFWRKQDFYHSQPQSRNRFKACSCCFRDGLLDILTAASIKILTQPAPTAALSFFRHCRIERLFKDFPINPFLLLLLLLVKYSFRAGIEPATLRKASV